MNAGALGVTTFTQNRRRFKNISITSDYRLYYI